MTETEPDTALDFLRSLAAFVIIEPEPLEAVTIDDLLTERVLTLNTKGDWHYAGT